MYSAWHSRASLRSVKGTESKRAALQCPQHGRSRPRLHHSWVPRFESSDRDRHGNRARSHFVEAAQGTIVPPGAAAATWDGVMPSDRRRPRVPGVLASLPVRESRPPSGLSRSEVPQRAATASIGHSKTRPHSDGRHLTRRVLPRILARGGGLASSAAQSLCRAITDELGFYTVLP